MSEILTNKEYTQDKEEEKDISEINENKINKKVSSKKKITNQVEVWTQVIRGIIYYIDNNYNIYNPGDIILLQKNPRIIGKCMKINDSDKYVITELTKENLSYNY
jgi:ATP-dependent 26S proteasome regulatory subunit